MINKFNKRVRLLLCAFDIYSKYKIIKNNIGITITNVFQKSIQKANKIRADKGSEFYNRSMRSFLQNNNMKMYSTHKEGKSVIAESFIRTFKNKIYKYMTSVSKNVYTDKLDAIVDKYNNTYHS